MNMWSTGNKIILQMYGQNHLQQLPCFSPLSCPPFLPGSKGQPTLSLGHLWNPCPHSHSQVMVIAPSFFQLYPTRILESKPSCLSFIFLTAATGSITLLCLEILTDYQIPRIKLVLYKLSPTCLSSLFPIANPTNPPFEQLWTTPHSDAVFSHHHTSEHVTVQPKLPFLFPPI